MYISPGQAKKEDEKMRFWYSVHYLRKHRNIDSHPIILPSLHSSLPPNTQLMGHQLKTGRPSTESTLQLLAVLFKKKASLPPDMVHIHK